MTIGSLAAILEQLNQDEELVIEITKDDGEAITAYDIGFDYSESGDFMLKVLAQRSTGNTASGNQ
jgi:hypothetical protein